MAMTSSDPVWDRTHRNLAGQTASAPDGAVNQVGKNFTGVALITEPAAARRWVNPKLTRTLF